MLTRGQAGLSMVEILVAMAVLAIMVTAAVPAYVAWVQNTQIRTAAESLKNGLQMARTEAIQTNRNVKFALTTISGWKVNPNDDPDKDPALAERSHNDGSPNVTIVTVPAASTEVVFNSFGQVINGAALTQIDVQNPIVAADEARPLRILIPSGGSAKLCDPKVTAPTDTRRCPP